MEIKARFDQIVGWRQGNGNPGDADYVPQGPDMRSYHFTFGKPGAIVSGGFYIKIGEMVGLPKEITLTIPPIDGQLAVEKWREKHERVQIEAKAKEEKEVAGLVG